MPIAAQWTAAAMPTSPRLIYLVAAVPGIERIRFTTSHPVEFRDSLIEAYRDVPQLANYLHLPVQSGSDRVLSLMKRGHTVLEYKQKLRRLRAVRPDICLTTDIIVGFSRARQSAISRPRSTSCATSASTRASASSTARVPGTPAASLADDVTHAEKQSAARAPAGPAQRAGACDQPRDGRHDAARAGRAAVEA
jgi:tRNA-2-methylthio-N6-dimethylallyladenosine synthase